MTDVPPPPPKSPMILILVIGVAGALMTALAYTVTSLFGLAPPILLRLPFHRLQWEGSWLSLRSSRQPAPPLVRWIITRLDDGNSATLAMPPSRFAAAELLGDCHERE